MVITVWVYCMLCIASIGEIEANTEYLPQHRKVVRTDDEDTIVTYMSLFMLFGILWITAFI